MRDGTMHPETYSENDALTEHAIGAGVWGNPTEPDAMQQPAHLPQQPGFDYSAGMFVGVPGTEADAVPGALHPIVVRRRTDVPPSYQVPHESTHRRYEAPATKAVNQAAAGFTLIAPPQMGLHYIKVIAVNLTLDAAGTIKFVQGALDGTGVLGDITGTMNTGGAAAPPILLPPAEIETPWFFCSPDQALGIFTVTGKAQGFVTYCYSPYEA